MVKMRSVGLNSTTPKEDRISLLPNPILIHILSMLPLRVAIQMSCLSKQWACLWTFMPSLSFDQLSYPTSKFVKFVDYTLMLYNSESICRFSLKMNELCGSKLLTWLRFAFNRSVKELELEFFDDFDKIPLSICFSSSLVKLSLCCGSIIHHPNYVIWPSLKCLVLREMYLVHGILKKILVGCPMLEELVLKTCLEFREVDVSSLVNLKKLVIEFDRFYYEDDFSDGEYDGEYDVSDDEDDGEEEEQDNKFSIIGSNLRSLVMNGIGPLTRRMYHLENLSSVTEAKVVFDTLDSTFYLPMMVVRNRLGEIINGICHVEKLTLSRWSFEVFALPQLFFEGETCKL